MVEIEVTKGYSESKKTRSLVQEINKLKVFKYKTDCKLKGDRFIVSLYSFRKSFTFCFVNNPDGGYDLTVPKITHECMLLSKAIEKLSGKKVKIILGTKEQQVKDQFITGLVTEVKQDIDFHDCHALVIDSIAYPVYFYLNTAMLCLNKIVTLRPVKGWDENCERYLNCWEIESYKNNDCGEQTKGVRNQSNTFPSSKEGGF